MPTSAATALYLAFIAWLFMMDRRYRPMTSAALWITIAWWSIIGSKPVSFWLTGGVVHLDSPDQSLEGSPIDSGVYLFLLLLGLLVLGRRRVQLSAIWRENAALCIFMSYCLLSTAWSEYPMVAAKRWVKDCGNIIVVLIIMTDADPRAAIRAVLGRLTYLLIPTSVMVIKYHSDIGRYYDQWTWTPFFSGVTTDKNALGLIAALSGVFLVWDILYARRRTRSRSSILPGPNQPDVATAPAHGRRSRGSQPLSDSWSWYYLGSQLLLFGMVLRLISVANSSTAAICFLLGAVLVFAFGHESSLTRHFASNLWRYVILISVTGALVVSSTDVAEVFFSAMGEDATLTGRTDIWADVIALTNNTILGAGYQSFWLGSSGQLMWDKYYFHPNQAHNGYIETYINGGLVGLGLLIAFIWASATRLRARMLKHDVVSTLLLALLIMVIFYSITEAVFSRLSPAWLACLLACVSYSSRTGRAVSGPRIKRERP